jgi:hypothetical protein
MAFIGWDANTKPGHARNRPRKAKHPIKPMLVQEQPAARIRAYRNPQGHGIKVVHEPSEGVYHVELYYDSVAGAPAMTRSDKNEIKLKLIEIFSDLSQHNCPE